MASVTIMTTWACPYTLSGRTSYRKISWSLEVAILHFIMFLSLWNLPGFSAAMLPRCLANFWAIGKVQTQISRLRGFTRPCGKTSVRLVNRGHEVMAVKCMMTSWRINWPFVMRRVSNNANHWCFFIVSLNKSLEKQSVDLIRSCGVIIIKVSYNNGLKQRWVISLLGGMVYV